MPYDSGDVYEYISKYYANKGKFEPEYIAGQRYVIEECSYCGMLFQLYIPDDFLLAKIYSEWINYDGAKSRREGLQHKMISQFNFEQHLLRYWGKRKPLKVLDYGMGHGEWLDVAFVFGHEVYGYEYDENRQSNAANGKVKVIGYNDIPNSNFDFINTEQVFEHLAYPYEVLKVLKSGLKKDGLVRISVPSGNGVKERLKTAKPLVFHKNKPPYLNAVDPLQHLNCYSGKSMKVMAERAGLQQYQMKVGWVISSKSDWTGRNILKNIVHPFYSRLKYKNTSPMQYFRNPQL